MRIGWKMVYVKVNAGLCNQMYFFSTAYALAKEWGEELIIDIDVDGNMEWTYLLDEFQMPPYKKIIYPKRYYAGKEYVKLAFEIREKVAIIDEDYFEQVGEYLTIPKEKFKKENPAKDVYLKGVFLKRQMFEKYLPDLREIFVLRRPSAFVQEFERRIENIIAIGVHIRKQTFSVFENDNSMDFFRAAIVYMRQRYRSAKFYIFSDDLYSVKEQLGSAKDFFYVDALNEFMGDVEEFVCLTKCHHYILTRRSTYGRMAEILNRNDNKISVLFGDNTWNDPENRFHFLSLEKVKKLSRLFEKKQIMYNFKEEILRGKTNEELKEQLVRIGLDSGCLTLADRRKLLFIKAKLYADEGQYGQAVNLCRMLEERWGERDKKFHKFFGDLLIKHRKVREAFVEYICASENGEVVGELIRNEEYRHLWEGGRKKHYVIAPFGPYSSQYLSEMQVIGLILARMGNTVSYIFKKGVLESQENGMNSQMIGWENDTDHKWMNRILENGFSVGKYYYGYPCYDYVSIMENKNNNFMKIAKKYPGKETILVGRDPQIISEDMPFRKVFIDFSSPFDEAYRKDEIKKEEMDSMYKCADVVVTRSGKSFKDGQQIIQIEESLLERSQLYVEMEIPCYEPTIYTDDYLEIALQIANFCNA